MTDTFRALCAELLDVAEELGELIEAVRTGEYRPDSFTLQPLRAIANRARAALAQPKPEGPTDEELDRLWWQYVEAPDVVMALGKDGFRRAYRAGLARWGHQPAPQPEEGDIHYAWELHDAEGDWQAGGSANSLEDVQREGNHYLQTYSQDRPHKLIIQRHCVSTIEFDHHDFY